MLKEKNLQAVGNMRKGEIRYGNDEAWCAAGPLRQIGVRDEKF